MLGILIAAAAAYFYLFSHKNNTLQKELDRAHAPNYNPSYWDDNSFNFAAEGDRGAMNNNSKNAPKGFRKRPDSDYIGQSYFFLDVPRMDGYLSTYQP